MKTKIRKLENTKVKDIVAQHEAGMLRPNEEYQRGQAWKEHQEKMFIDSLMRDYKAPAFYFHDKSTIAGGERKPEYDIVDGQQRINAIVNYIKGNFKLLDPSAEEGAKFPNFLKNKNTPWGGKKFDDLSEYHQESLRNHELVIYDITTDDPNEVRDLFIRLQAGTPLTAQDKRDAWPGEFTKFVLRVGGKTSQNNRWLGWPLFTERCNKTKGARRQLAAQAFMLYWTKSHEKRFCDISSRSLDEFYHQQINFVEKCAESKEFEEICRTLNEEFRAYPKLVGHHLLHLVLLVGDLRAEFSPHWQGRLGDALATFKQRCQKGKEANDAGDNESEFHKYYAEYGQGTRNSSDIAATIQRRHLFFHEKMTAILGATRKHSRRAFSRFDKEEIFKRDGRRCQYCEMERESNSMVSDPHTVAWGDAEIHHVMPHKDGGKTVLANGVLVHKKCHPKAREAVEEFRVWWIKREEMSSASSQEQKGKIPDVTADSAGILSVASQEQSKKTKASKSRELPPDGTELRISLREVKYRHLNVKGEIKGRKIVISGEVNGTFTSPSSAGKHVTGRSTNGWDFWEIKTPNSDRWMLATDWRDLRD